VRPWSRTGLTVAERLALVVADAAGDGLRRDRLATRLGVAGPQLESTFIAISDHVVSIGDTLFDLNLFTSLAKRVVTAVDDFHIREPLEDGMSLQAVRSTLGVAPALADEVLRQLGVRGSVVVERGLVRRGGWSPAPSGPLGEAVDVVDRVLHASGREPPSVGELAAEYGTAVVAVLRYLERRRRIVQVEPDRYYAASALDAIVADLRRGTETGRAYGPSELRELLGVSRKYLIPLLEYCDRQSVTVRRDAGRIVQAV
jgi:selenocysteine-specific elongation factor